MYEEQVRINAMISYFFLGPIFLMARSGSPLADPYVRLHAKRSSIIILLGLGGYASYFFLKPLLLYPIFGISLATIVLALIVSVLVGYLVYNAYRAYHGDTATWISLGINSSGMSGIDNSHRTEAEKIRIIASYIPLLGIWISSKYDERSILIGRKVGTFAFIIIVSSSLFLDGATGLSLILTLLTIILIVFSGVSLFTMGTLPIFRIYDWIPTYREIEAHIGASLKWLGGFMRILGGSEQGNQYRTLYEDKLAQSAPRGYTTYFPVSPALIGLPIVNVFTLPFLFQTKYSEYRDVVLQWLFLSVLFALVWYFYGWQSGLQAYLVIPMITLLSFAPLSATTRAPGVSIILWFVHLFGKWKEKIGEIKSKEEKVSYAYTQEEKPVDVKTPEIKIPDASPQE